MQTHVKMILLGSIAAVALLVGALMAGSYVAAFGVLISAFVVGCAYLIGVAGFDEPRAGPRPRGSA